MALKWEEDEGDPCDEEADSCYGRGRSVVAGLNYSARRVISLFGEGPATSAG